ncbi:hypothetical protein [Paraclostridium sordellii]|uniref:hypothetical protein n=1 Tax=Paraclostridium sordellii TaxID=1505 RepID=UPI0005E50AFE|nr:hypothetical protein [Paeniclostridium sordellii]QYE98846.1 hypothetical protein KZ987_04840 [Paeniclostridium sordellii]CEO06203.1 Uncharacterised protein [[Clostridium] sordellii] [Paeniclostridium sordellii]CEP86428.1 Uncharacterised protein [[Clostridium] sordellii] [Paeniclostridium sordellii]CEP96679.1 Uncharacterised protein [[Clostridium] sordellii] [Paeniclostridium sordellii]CEP99855.1 Uncharacterised protein [[Clostridium] sordellii] [Paeniclostridium sordellii]
MKLNKRLILMSSISIISINMVGCSQKNFYNEKVKETIDTIKNTKIGKCINKFMDVDISNSVNELIDTGIVKKIVDSINVSEFKNNLNNFLDIKVFE